MASTPRIATSNFPVQPVRQQDELISSLLQLQKATKKITSILDLETLIDSVVNDVVCHFGCIEADIFLRHETRDEMIAASAVGCSIHGKGHALKIGKEGMVGHVAFTGEMHYAPDVTLDPYYIVCEHDARSAVAIPMKVAGRVIGVFNAVHPELDGFPSNQLRALQALSEHIAIAVENARLFRNERKLNQRFQQESQEAQQIQQQLLPNSSLLLSDFTVSGATLPVGAVGGDWYDYFELPNGKLGVVLADVSGKGMAAALLMSATRGLLRAVADSTEEPGEVLAKVNRALLRDFPAGRYITMVYGVLDPIVHTFTFANAGHPWPVILNGSCAQLIETQTGLPLGIAETAFSEATIILHEGARILLYSDGISEAANLKQEEFGTDRLRDLVRRRRVSTASILADVREFSGNQAVFDDATVVLISARG